MTQIRIEIADLHIRENTVEGALPLQKMFDVTVILLDGGFAQPALLPSPSAVRLTLPLKGGRRHRRLKMTQKSKPGHRKTQVPLPSERRVEWSGHRRTRGSSSHLPKPELAPLSPDAGRGRR